MRRMLLQFGAVALVFAPPVALPTVAQAQSASGQVDICETLVESGSYESVGECVSEMRTSPLDFCKFLKDIEIWETGIRILFPNRSNRASRGQCRQSTSARQVISFAFD